MDGILTLARLKTHLRGLEAAELGEVIVQLFGASSANKRLLTALLEGDTRSLREQVDREIDKAFGVGSRPPSLKTANLRAALRQYARVAAPEALLHAELDAVAAGIRCMAEYGDLEESVSHSLERLWAQALKRCPGLLESEVPWNRLESLRQSSQNHGWGFSEEIEAAYQNFLAAIGPDQPPAP